MRWFIVIALMGAASGLRAQQSNTADIYNIAVKQLRNNVLKEAEKALKEKTVTVTAQTSPRSAGGIHDFYSEGDYWWPNPANADSPYIQKDGMTNPGNFVAHRLAMIRLSRIVGVLASAWRITGHDKYVTKAMEHCKAWFVDTATKMNPSLLYAQAIKGRATGRGIGIIDAIQLIEVAQGLYMMQQSPAMDQEALNQVKQWFAQYLDWVTSHQYGIDEMNAANNHGTCWVMQVASFAKFTGNQKWMDFCSDRYKKCCCPTRWRPTGVSQRAGPYQTLWLFAV